MATSSAPKFKNYHMTPKSGRISLTLDKDTQKVLKKIGIDLEMPECEVIPFVLEVVGRKMDGMNLYGLSPEEIRAELLGIPIEDIVDPGEESGE